MELWTFESTGMNHNDWCCSSQRLFSVELAAEAAREWMIACAINGKMVSVRLRKWEQGV